MWGWRDLAAAHHPVVRVEGTVAIDGDDLSGGWMCGASDTLFAFGVVDADGDWRIGHIIDGEVTVDLEGDVARRLRVGRRRERGVRPGERGQHTAAAARRRGLGRQRRRGTAGTLRPRGVRGRQRVGRGLAPVRRHRGVDGRATTSRPTRHHPRPARAPTTPVVTGVLGADTLAFEDDFSRPDQWGTGSRRARAS